MSEHTDLEGTPHVSKLGRFLRRLSWRRQVGPLSAEAELEVRELNTESPPHRERGEDRDRNRDRDSAPPSASGS